MPPHCPSHLFMAGRAHREPEKPWEIVGIYPQLDQAVAECKIAESDWVGAIQIGVYLGDEVVPIKGFYPLLPRDYQPDATAERLWDSWSKPFEIAQQIVSLEIPLESVCEEEKVVLLSALKIAFNKPCNFTGCRHFGGEVNKSFCLFHQKVFDAIILLKGEV